MGRARLELARISPPHFECGASTNSAIRPGSQLSYYTQLGDFCSSAAPMKNIFEELPGNLEMEVFEILASSDTTKIERIVSKGHTTASGKWYDQDRHEWVIVLQGEALLIFEDGESMRLTQGSYVNIPAHTKHRVDWTDPTQETIWLAIHY